jgi:type I restriction enzyme S subunit
VFLSDRTREKYRAAQGDILVIRVNGSKEITGQFILCNVDDLVFCDHFIRMRIADDLAHPHYLAALSNSSLIRRQIEQSLVSTAGQNTINQSRLRSVLIPLPPRVEQERIVAAIEQQLSRIDAGVAALQSARTRVLSLVKAVLLAAVPDEPPPDWTTVTVGEAGEVRLGRQRSPRFHRGPHMRPYLRVANVFEDRIDTSDVMTMHFSDEEFAQYRLEPGDILLNEGQSPHLLGRPAMYRGDPPNVAFTNSLLRFRANTGVLPEWALLVFRRHLHAKRFMRESQITTNIAHLSAGRFKNIEFPIPSVDEQRRILTSVDERLSVLAAMLITLDQQRVRATTIRSAILAAAFSGRLVPQDPSDEPASVLLERIASERAASNGHRPSTKPGITKVSHER